MAPSFSIIAATLACLMSCFSDHSQAAGPNFSMLPLDKLAAPVSCHHFDEQRDQSLKIVHRYGPCSPYNKSEPSLRETMAQDSLRVASLQARLSGTLMENKTIIGPSVASLPLKSGIPLGIGNYVVTIGLGTPSRAQTVEIDTGSDVCWVQCKPCTTCYSQQQPIFDPSVSSSYRRLDCSSTACVNLHSGSCSAGSCVYDVLYGDGSSTTGFLSSDSLSLTPAVSLQSFIFGCGISNQGLFSGTAGLVGLGRGSSSLHSQTAYKFGNAFSYCFPDQVGSTGRLTLGKSSASSAVYTAMLTDPSAPSFYFIDLVGISVGAARLPVSASIFQTTGTIIDSGTVITRLPPSAYAALRSAFRSSMSPYKLFQGPVPLDTCYEFSNVGTVRFPHITLHFTGLDVTLGAAGVFFNIGNSKYCLAFAGNSDATELGIIGNVQQRTFEVIYDIGERKIGFVAGACA